MTRAYRQHNKDQNHPDFPHGLFAGYSAGCKCEDCNKANNQHKLDSYYQRNPKIIKTTKICKTCKEEKPLADFYLHNGDKWPEPNCKVCLKILKREYNLKKEYGLTLEDYNSLLIAQNQACAICKRFFCEFPDRVPHVDHDHTTGKIRGILCFKCNPSIGLQQDDYDISLNATFYLLRAAGFNDYLIREYILSKMEAPSP